jgi:putative membrane protein
MFVDFLTLIMINLIAGTVLLAYYLWKGLDEKDQRPYAAAFFATGLLGLITGLQLSFTWPLPGSYNIAFGDTSTLFGVVFLATSLALWQGWNLIPVSIYAFFAGAEAVLVGYVIYAQNLTKEPVLSAIGFALAGLGGLGAFPFFMWFRKNQAVRWIAIAVLVVTAGLWAVTFYGSVIGHMTSFAKWPGMLNVMFPPAPKP